MTIASKRKHQFDVPIALPETAGDPPGVANRDFWIDNVAGKLAFRLSGATILVPLPSEVAAGGLTQEQIEDFVSLMNQDNAHLDWTYTDNGAGAGTLVAVIKAGSVNNAELANMAQSTIKLRPAGAGSGPPIDGTPAQLKTILALASTDLSDFVSAARAAITVADTATLDLTYAGGQISGTVLDSPTVGGLTAAQIQTAVINAISNGAGPAYDTLVEIQALLQADDTLQAGLTSGLALRARFFAAALTAGSPTATVTHGLNLTNIHDFMYRIVVSATGAEEEYEAVGASANTITVTDETGANIPAGRRIFLTAGV